MPWSLRCNWGSIEFDRKSITPLPHSWWQVLAVPSSKDWQHEQQWCIVNLMSSYIWRKNFLNSKSDNTDKVRRSASKRPNRSLRACFVRLWWSEYLITIKCCPEQLTFHRHGEAHCTDFPRHPGQLRCPNCSCHHQSWHQGLSCLPSSHQFLC